MTDKHLLQHSPGISVVVPSYNHAPFVERTLWSIIRQTLPPSELLVIDDGSSDESPRIIERALRDCPFPSRLIARSNEGLSRTLNEGLRRTHGNYFAYLSSDDVWLPDFLAERARLLESRPGAVLAYGHAYHIDERDRIIKCTIDWANFVDGNAKEMLFQPLVPFSSSVLYRRAAVEKYGWNEAARLEDYELYLYLSIDGEFAFDPQVLSAWRQHSSNTSRDPLLMQECLDAQRRAMDYLQINAGDFEALQTALKVKYAEYFAKRGYKTEAVKLLRSGVKIGSENYSGLARTLLYLLIPGTFTRGLKQYIEYRAHQRYGSVNL